MVIRVEKTVPHSGCSRSPERGIERTSGIVRAGKRGIDIAVGQRVDGLCAYVSDACGDIAGQFPLDDKVPRLDVTAVQAAAPRAAVVHCGRKVEGAAVQVRTGEERDALWGVANAKV